MLRKDRLGPGRAYRVERATLWPSRTAVNSRGRTNAAEGTRRRSAVAVSIEYNMMIGTIHAALHIEVILCRIARDI